MSRFGDMRFLSSSSSFGGRFVVPTSRRCNLSPPPSDAASHYFLGGKPCVVTGPNVTAAVGTPKSRTHVCQETVVRLTFAKKNPRKTYLYEVQIAFLLREMFLKEKSFSSLANAIHCCMQVGLSKGEERRRGSSASAALLRFSLPPSFSPLLPGRLTTTTQPPLKSTHFLHNLYASLALASGERRRAFPLLLLLIQRPPTLSFTHAYTRYGMACVERQFCCHGFQTGGYNRVSIECKKL